MADKEARENVSGAGEGTEEGRNIFVSEKEGNNAALPGERIMELVGSPEE